MYKEIEIMEELKQEFQKSMREQEASNQNEVAIKVEAWENGRDVSKVFVEKNFFGCGSSWFSIDKKHWRIAKELGFKKGYYDWQCDYQYGNGSFGLMGDARSRAIRKIKEKYPESAVAKLVGQGSWVD